MSLRHFFKHLSCRCAARFPARRPRLLRRFPAEIRFSTLPSRMSSGVRRRWELRSFSHANVSFSTCSSQKYSETCADSDPSSFVSYISVRIHCPKDAADMLSEALLCFGAISTSVDEQDSDESTDEIFISATLPKGEHIATCIPCAADSIGLKDVPSYEVIMYEEYDWIKKTQESFDPVKVTEGLWIVPEWRSPPDLQATNIILNPGLTFGTGDHPTTKLCLMLLRCLIKGGENFLDYGTGSGILAIAALKFGAALSVGVDIDPQAIRVAHRNAILNNMTPDRMQLHLVPCDTNFSSRDTMTAGCMERHTSSGTEFISETEKYDLVIANILLNPLLDVADDIVSYAKPGAVVCVSGILSEQLPHIMERYSQLLEGISVTEMDGWACASGTKKMCLGKN